MIRVTEAERQQINRGMVSVREHFTPNAGTQFGRVTLCAAGADWYTLRQLESLIAGLFPEHKDTQAAISARLREVSPSRCGLVKQKQIIRIKDKSVYFYRLIPARVASKPLEAA